MEYTYDEFCKHINTGDQYCRGEDELNVPGPLTNGEETKVLHDYATNIIPDGNIIEIGSWLGLSTITLALSLKERNSNYQLFSIDPHDIEHSKSTDVTTDFWNGIEPGFDWHKKYIENLRKWGVRKHVISIREKSQDAFDYFQEQTISMVFIDGDHSKEAVFKDLENYVPLVKTDGYIIMHDSEHVNVIQATVDYFNKYPNVLEDRKNSIINTPEYLKLNIFRKI
jgi:MMP 1-O-methyltransferase